MNSIGPKAPWTSQDAQEYLDDLRAGSEEIKRVAANVELPVSRMAEEEMEMEDKAWRIALITLIASILALIGSCSLLREFDKGNNEPNWQDRELNERVSAERSAQ